MTGVCDPYAALPVRNDKYAALCTELHLGNRKITELSGFEAFVNLSTLWINNNRITALEGLDNNIRLRNLHAHNNRIKKLEGSSLGEFKFLENLTLNDNFLENMSDVLGELKYLRHLKSLDLFGNPISQEDNYRLLVLGEIPWLKTLDRSPVTQTEIRDAKRLRVELKKQSNIKLQAKHRTGENLEHPPLSARSKTFQHILPRLKEAFKAKRVFLENLFLESDPRKTGAVSEHIFYSGLKMFGILNLITEEELHCIGSKYRKSLMLTAISPNHTLSHDMVDYRKFCDDVLPPTLRVHNRAFDAADSWHMEPVPEVSITAKDLQRYVRKNKAAERKEAERKKREALFARRSDMDSSFTFSATGSRTLGNDVMDPWTVCQLRRFMVEAALEEKTAGGGGMENSVTLTSLTAQGASLSVESVRGILNKMQDIGKTTSRPTEDVIKLIFGENSELPLKDLCESLGCGDSGPNLGGNETGWSGNTTSRAQTPKVPRRHIVSWRNLTAEEMEHKESISFGNAGDLMDSLLRGANAGGEGAESRQKRFLSMTLQSSLVGTRMAASKPFRQPPPPDTSPASIIGSAPRRSDCVVIPALKSAALRAEKDRELRKTHDWDSQFASLGMKGDVLDIALARKKRSMTAAPRNNRTMTYDYNPKPSDRPKKGWSSSTGTLIFNSTT
mmetsp:Transcript_1787/g.2808  ORF Transcript_1787/g.2808 Transcript_1787/m.2808 type:complete len:673 (+) Transcript_1787:103-2121(+)